MTARLAFIAIALALAACNGKTEDGFQGWVEADLLFVGPDEGGRIETLSVREGDRIEQGAAVFTLDSALERADLAQSEASLINAKHAFERAQALLKTSAGTQRAYEDAEAALRTAQARFNSSQTRLVRRKVESPASGTVQQLYYRVGEMVPAGRPVVALLPPDQVKVRFFVPEAVLPKVSLGQEVSVRCDGCVDGLSGKVSFISRTAEYTPPVIYSLEERSKLVFLIEAKPAQPERLRVGQPVRVVLQGPAP
jgi:HlyD family secretion protein